MGYPVSLPLPGNLLSHWLCGEERSEEKIVWEPTRVKMGCLLGAAVAVFCFVSLSYSSMLLRHEATKKQRMLSRFPSKCKVSLSDGSPQEIARAAVQTWGWGGGVGGGGGGGGGGCRSNLPSHPATAH